MRILALSDVESRSYYDYYSPGKLDGVDLILSCGDLPGHYLEFMATMAHCPVVCVPGNHDDGYAKNPPGGCFDADGQVIVCQGLRICGLGGSFRYREGENMYTEAQMRRRIRRLFFSLHRHHGMDILLTHAPARHINDFESMSHRGFECYRDLLQRYHPRYFVHGHIHRNYGVNIPRRSVFEETTVINAYEHYLFDY